MFLFNGFCMFRNQLWSLYLLCDIYLLKDERIRPLSISPLLLCVKGYTSSTPTHNTSGLGAVTPVSPSVIALPVKACWCVSLPLQQQHSCVWYSVGGIQCSARKFMDQVRWLLSTTVCYNTVTPPPVNISVVFSSQLLQLPVNICSHSFRVT